MATLIIELSDAALARLQQRATAAGTTPEAVAAADLEPAAPPAEPEQPPKLERGEFIRRWAGAISSGVTDAGIRHDYYIGEALAEDLRAKPAE